MAIQQALQNVSFTLLPEVASRVILLTRTVTDNNNGTISVEFGGIIHPESITYETDANKTQTGIYERSDIHSIEIPEDKLMSLFGLKVTLADGTISSIGEVISSFTDQIISEELPDSGTITTQTLNLTAILAAQNAATAST